jgi:hypothetical protein
MICLAELANSNPPLLGDSRERVKVKNMLLQILDKQKGIVYINTEQIASIEYLNEAAIIMMSNGIKYTYYNFENLVKLLKNKQ